MAALLDRIARRLEAKSDEGLREEIVTLRMQLREVDRLRPGTAERAHAAVEETLARLRAHRSKRLAGFAVIQAPLEPAVGFAGSNQALLELAGLAAVEQLGPLWHAAVDEAAAAGLLSTRSEAELDTERAKVYAQLVERRQELERRRVAREREQLERRLADLAGGELPERQPSGVFEIRDEEGGVVATVRDLVAWQSSTTSAEVPRRHNAAQDRVEYVAPRFTVVPLDADAEPILELAETWSPELAA